MKQYKVLQNEDRLKCGEAWIQSNMLFTQWNEKPMYPYTATRWFPKFIKRYNEKIGNNTELSDEQKQALKLPMLNFHGLQHTNATLLIAGGTNLKTISARLGHANTSTTLNVYAHSLRSADKEAANKLEDILTVKNSRVK